MGYNQKMFGLGSKRSIIREIFEYSKSRAAEIGADKVFDFRCQRRRCMDGDYDFFFCIFIDYKFIFHRFKSLSHSCDPSISHE